MATLAHSDEHGLWMHFARFEGPKVGSPDVLLIPMIHVANRDFLQEAYEETWRYDFALYEGAYVPMTSVFRHIYPVLAKVLGLTPQGSGKISLERQGGSARVMRPRVSVVWSKLSTGQTCNCLVAKNKSLPIWIKRGFRSP